MHKRLAVFRLCYEEGVLWGGCPPHRDDPYSYDIYLSCRHPGHSMSALLIILFVQRKRDNRPLLLALLLFCCCTVVLCSPPDARYIRHKIYRSNQVRGADNAIPHAAIDRFFSALWKQQAPPPHSHEQPTPSATLKEGDCPAQK